MIRQTPLSRRARLVASAATLASAILGASGCTTGDEASLAQVPADATEKVKQGQTKPVKGADRLPPTNQQSKGIPH